MIFSLHCVCRCAIGYSLRNGVLPPGARRKRQCQCETSVLISMSGPSTRPPAAAFGTRFEKILEIKNSALLLAFASQEIKEIKRCPTRNGSSCRTWREAILENSPIELKEGQ